MSSAWKCLLEALRQAVESHWIKHFLALLFPQCFCIRWSHPCPHLWQSYPALSYSIRRREDAQTPRNVKALMFTQCDTDPAQRTRLLRYAGRTLISLICSPSSLVLTQRTETTERKWFCGCLESSTSGLSLNRKIEPCLAGHWGTLLPSRWTKPANLPLLPSRSLWMFLYLFKTPASPPKAKYKHNVTFMRFI